MLQQDFQTKEQRPIYLYTHWGGTELPEVLANALARRERWDDDAYLTRIIFCEMVKDDVAGETGYGIAIAPPDNEHPYLVVDIAKQEVRVVATAPWDAPAPDPATAEPLYRFTFQEFVDNGAKTLGDFDF